MPRTSVRRFRTLSSQLRKLRNLKVDMSNLRHRKEDLDLWIHATPEGILRKVPWLKLDIKSRTRDLQISSSGVRRVAELQQKWTEAMLPVATDSLKQYGHEALHRSDLLSLSVQTTVSLSGTGPFF